MDFHNPKSFFILVLIGATMATLVYIASMNIVSYTGHRFAESHVVNVEHDLSFLRKEHQFNHTLEVQEQKTKRKHPRPFITMASNNAELSFRIDQKLKFSSCPSSLHAKLQESHWASQYYRPGIKMIMTDGNINQEEYQRLKSYNMPFGFFDKDNLTFEELSRTLKLFSEEESVLDFRNHQRPRCVSCAIVGNGGILKGAGMGKKIDNHDMVFRVNYCIRRGFEHDVGTRTTHYVFMDRSLRHMQQADIPNDKGIKWVFLPCRIEDYYYISEVANGTNPKQRLKAQAADIRLLHPDFVRYVHKVWMQTKSFRPSTGFVMFMTAIHSGCDSLSVYGMGINTKYSGYYYDKKFRAYEDVPKSHDFSREVEILKELDKAGIIKWHKRNVPEFLS